MSSFDIGISGLNAAQKALSIIGNNIANAATEGYHRQDVDLRPADEAFTSGLMIGQGVNYTGIRRQINSFLESELIRQQSSVSQSSRQLDTLRLMESSLGELSDSSLSEVISQFFTSFQDLSLAPRDVNLQTAVQSAAESLTIRFQNMGTILRNLQDSFYAEAQSQATIINDLSDQVARLNQEIYKQKIQGKDAANTMDQRDRLIQEMGQLISVKTINRDYGVVDVQISDLPLVTGSISSRIEVALIKEGSTYFLGMAPEGSENYNTQVTGGTMGALFSLRNELVKDVENQLDTLAQNIISEVNKIHVQGIGESGSFTSLTGWTMTETEVTNFVPKVTDGTIYVRVTDPSGTVRRYSVTVDSSSTLNSVAADLAAIPGLEDNTGMVSDRLQIVANTGYKFDFLPEVLSTPTTTVPSPLAGAGAGADEQPPEITISGVYTGSVNQTYTCTVNTSPGGSTVQIGNGSVDIVVTDGAGSTVATISLGQDYVSGTPVLIEDGVYISFGSNGSSAGYLNDGEVITIDALASSDTSGFLAAVGINAFFTGIDTNSIGVSQEIQQSGTRIAVARASGAQPGESVNNHNCLALAALANTSFTELGSKNLRDYYRGIAVDVGLNISMLEREATNAEALVRNLKQQRDDVSGVDINEQASLMMVYERMFQGIAKYMNTVSGTLDVVMRLLD